MSSRLYHNHQIFPLYPSCLTLNTSNARDMSKFKLDWSNIIGTSYLADLVESAQTQSILQLPPLPPDYQWLSLWSCDRCTSEFLFFDFVDFRKRYRTKPSQKQIKSKSRSRWTIHFGDCVNKNRNGIINTTYFAGLMQSARPFGRNILEDAMW